MNNGKYPGGQATWMQTRLAQEKHVAAGIFSTPRQMGLTTGQCTSLRLARQGTSGSSARMVSGLHIPKAVHQRCTCYKHALNITLGGTPRMVIPHGVPATWGYSEDGKHLG